MEKEQVLSGAEPRDDTEPRPVAYSYVRFSTAKQELGDSLRRQVAAAEEYCLKHGLELHPVSYRDLGVSAFKRKNLEKGALAAFINAVKTGIVAKGSYLVIEQFDRLSRADIDYAVKLLLDLVHSGIKVVTLVDEMVWDSKTVKQMQNLMMAIIWMSRANNESAAKADRLSKAWGQKKKIAGQPGSRVVTSECPRWLRVTQDKKGFEVLEDRVESIKKVFDMRLRGLGVSRIVATANREKWPVPGKPPLYRPGVAPTKEPTWHTSLVGRLLVNRALLGEYQPHQNGAEDSKRIPVGEPVLGYYPAVIDETTFLRVQAAKNRRQEEGSHFPGRRDASLKNWLQGILKCSCGQSFVRKNKNSEAQPGYARYYCQARNRGLSKCPGANAGELENAVLAVVSTVAPAFFNGTARVEELKARGEIAEVEVSAAKQTRDRFVEAIGSTKAPVAALVKKVNEAELEVQKHEKSLSAIRAELADLEGDSEDVFENIVRAVREVNSIEARGALREDLSRVLSKVVVFQHEGYIEAHIRGSETPVVHRLREDALFPGQQPVKNLPSPAGFVLGLPSGFSTKPLSPEEHAAYLIQLDENGE